MTTRNKFLLGTWFLGLSLASLFPDGHILSDLGLMTMAWTTGFWTGLDTRGDDSNTSKARATAAGRK